MDDRAEDDYEVMELRCDMDEERRHTRYGMLDYEGEEDAVMTMEAAARLTEGERNVLR